MIDPASAAKAEKYAEFHGPSPCEAWRGVGKPTATRRQTGSYVGLDVCGKRADAGELSE